MVTDVVAHGDRHDERVLSGSPMISERCAIWPSISTPLPGGAASAMAVAAKGLDIVADGREPHVLREVERDPRPRPVRRMNARAAAAFSCAAVILPPAPARRSNLAS